MRKIVITVYLVLIVVAVAVVLQFTSKSDSKDLKTLTKALCNSTNYCQDYTINCENNQPVQVQAITGAAIQHSQDWEDSRNLSNLCS